jgi:tRNA(Ile)-lysidine synthase TilS/MesJ
MNFFTYNICIKLSGGYYMQKLMSRMRAAMEKYEMVQNGDRIAVGLSGGKDSVALLAALAEMRRFYPADFEVVAITVDMRFDNKDTDYTILQELCDRLDVPFVIKRTELADIIFNIRKETNPCSLCAKMRRGALHDAALELGSHKVALGHHWDDALETFMLSLVYEGRVNCFSPVTYLDRKDITLIRPMLYAPEAYIAGFAKRYELPVVKNLCPADKHTKREYVKDLVKQLERENPGFKTRLFTAIEGSHAGNFGVFPD